MTKGNMFNKSMEEEMREDYEKPGGPTRDCKWSSVCPMKRFYEQGELDKKWREKYCHGDWESCRRYEMEENGEPHPDWLLPDGTRSEHLKKLVEGRN